MSSKNIPEDKAIEVKRQEIDEIDCALQTLLNKRAVLAKEIADIKANQALEPGFYRPEREAQVLRNIIARNEGPLDDEEIARLFREIMSACLALEQPMKVAYLGPEGTFTQAAALKFFGHSVKTVSLRSIDDVFREVESGSAHYGMVPIENSTEGVVNHTLDSFMESNLKICGEVALRIHHHLLVSDGTIKDIKRVYSHQQSFAQCREWLNANLSGIEQVTVSSNAEATRRAQSERGSAAIAGDLAAELYAMTMCVANIEDKPDNTTRFLAISKVYPKPSGEDKTSLLISAHNKPGTLYRILEPFTRKNISLNRIESRPSKNALWDYVFFIDIDGHCDDEMIAEVMSELSESALFCKHLGSYPKAVL